jgi:hypothetical protein
LPEGCPRLIANRNFPAYGRVLLESYLKVLESFSGGWNVLKPLQIGTFLFAGHILLES